jgi:1-acyl-sn-glycerol-3-phosphate acyltransferase
MTTRRHVGPAAVVLRQLVRVPLLLLWVVVGVFLSLRAATVRGEPARRNRVRARITRVWMRGLLRILGIRVRSYGVDALPSTVLLAANHLSWLDILVLSASAESTFVSKAEVASWPVLGPFARAGGTVFVRRGDGRSALEVRAAMAHHLRDGGRLAFFPEGTTGDGRAIRHFRPRLFAAAADASVPVCPVALHYRERSGESCSAEVAFVGEETIVVNLLKLLARPRFDAEVLVGLARRVSPEDDLREIAAGCETFVRTAYTRLRAPGPVPLEETALAAAGLKEIPGS